MIRSKLGLLGLCAVVLGMMAMSAGSAQGATLSWLVLNAAKTTATELKAELVAENDTEHLSLLTQQFGLQVFITCVQGNIISGFLQAVGIISAGSKYRAMNCEAYLDGPLKTNLNCKVHSPGAAAGTIETGKLKGQLVLHTLAGGGTEVLARIEPEEAGGNFATILTEGCVLPESNPVKGVLYLKDCLKKATTHQLKHLLEQGPLTKLFVGADTAEHLETSLLGSSWVKLGGAHKDLDWAGMDA